MEYQPLDGQSNELRLLTIEPLKLGAETNSVVICTLEHIILEQDGFQGSALPNQFPNQSFFGHMKRHLVKRRRRGQAVQILNDSFPMRYEWGDFVALSYCWGDPNDTREIYLNGRSFQVTKNLEAGLQSLRIASFMRPGMRIWIDAVCINQHDLEERSREVRRMPYIYSMARFVIAWLGPEADRSQQAMEFIDNPWDTFPQWLASLNIPLPNTSNSFIDTAPHILSLLNRPYWRRLWILQELIAANFFIICGQNIISCQKFLAFQELLRTSFGSRHEFSAFLHSCSHSLNGIVRLTKCRDLYARYGNVRVDILMHLCSPADVSDCKDRVYGILSILETSLSASIIPDYTLDCWQIYGQFVMATIKTQSGLELLRLVQFQDHPVESFSWPSWIPDFNLRSRAIGFRSGYRACGSRIPTSLGPDLKANNWLLPCQGILFDIVDRMTALHALDYAVCRATGILSASPSVSRNNIYGNEESIKEALSRTFVADSLGGASRAPESFQKLLKLPTEDVVLLSGTFFKDHIDLNLNFNLFGLALQDYFNSVHTNDFTTDNYWTVLQSTVVMKGRRLATTHKGYLGLVPAAALPGDYICILFGCSTPMILRRAGGEFKLVGECYVHGIMNGEAIAEYKCGRQKAETFILS